ncbi:unnamed protein product [Effrenium voratum]|nr:unnamed protein product [Effrenium voratum]
METFAPIFVAVAMCLVAFCFSSHWQMLLADFRFLQAWHGQLQVSRGTDCPLAAAKKRRVRAALEDVRQKNFVLTARILTHFTALKALTLAYEFCQEPRVGALAHLAILAVGYAQHSVVGHGKFRPTPQQVRWLSSSIYLQFLATVSVHALTEPSESSGTSFSDKHILASRFALCMVFADAKLAVLFQFVLSFAVCWSQWYRGTAALCYAHVADECEVFVWLVTLSSVMELIISMRVQASLDMADAECMVSSFRRVLRSFCDCELLLDSNLQIQGNGDRLTRLLKNTADLNGTDFQDLLQDERTAFSRFLKASTEAADLHDPPAVKAAPCLRVSLREGPRADLFHVAVPQPSGEPFHLLALRADWESSCTSTTREANEDDLAASLLEGQGARGSCSESSLGTQSLPEILGLSLLVDMSSQELDVEQAQLSFLRTSPSDSLPTLQKLVRPRDWQHLFGALTSFAQRSREQPLDPEILSGIHLRTFEDPQQFMTAQTLEVSVYKSPLPHAGLKLHLQLSNFFA